METLYGWTCPADNAGYCDSILRDGFEGPCLECPLREIVNREDVA